MVRGGIVTRSVSKVFVAVGHAAAPHPETVTIVPRRHGDRTPAPSLANTRAPLLVVRLGVSFQNTRELSRLHWVEQ